MDFMGAFESIKTRRWEACKSGHLSDCTFLVKRQNEENAGNRVKFLCHKMILATASEVFERMLFGEFNEDVINIDDVTADVFKHFLKYIYTYEVDAAEINTQQCLKLFDMGYKYMMQDLIDECVKILRERKIWIITDILPIYKAACIYENLPLILLCYEKIQNNFKHVLHHETFFDLDLLQLKRLVILFSQGRILNFNVVLSALESYGNYHKLRYATPDSNYYADLVELKSIARILKLKFEVRTGAAPPSSYLYS